MQETWVPPLGWGDPLEKGMATHSNSLCWEEREEPGGLQSMGLQRVGHNSATNTFTLIKRLFRSSSLSSIIMTSFAYLTLLIFLPAILIPVCDSCSLKFYMMYSAVQFSCSVMSDSLQPHGLQHPRPPCPSPTPGVDSDSCPLSQ